MPEWSECASIPAMSLSRPVEREAVSKLGGSAACLQIGLASRWAGRPTSPGRITR